MKKEQAEEKNKTAIDAVFLGGNREQISGISRGVNLEKIKNRGKIMKK